MIVVDPQGVSQETVEKICKAAIEPLQAEIKAMLDAFRMVHASNASPPSAWGKGFESALEAVLNRIDDHLRSTYYQD